MAALGATAEEAGRRSTRHRAWDTVAAAADTPARVAAVAGARSRAEAVSSPELAVAAEEQGETEAVVVSLIGALVGAVVAVAVARGS